MSKRHVASSLDNFLKEEGIFEEAQTQAIKEVVAWRTTRSAREERSFHAAAVIRPCGSLYNSNQTRSDRPAKCAAICCHIAKKRRSMTPIFTDGSTQPGRSPSSCG